MEYHFISIYPLSEIEKINYYSGPFCGITYDSEEKIKVAREMARAFAEVKPKSNWNSYYPTNEEMDSIVAMINSLMKRKALIKAMPRDDFRFASIIDYYMGIKDVYKIPSYKEMIDNESIVKKIIVKMITDN